jgi:uncharacterized RDD family membrane protein YckC
MKKFASIWERGLAYVLDIVLLVPSCFVILLVGGDAHFGRSIVFMLGLYWLYSSGLESTFWQGTIGKRIMKIKVVQGEDGGQLSFVRALIRNLIKLFNLSWVLIVVTPNKQALHDMAVGSTVVKE